MYLHRDHQNAKGTTHPGAAPVVPFAGIRLVFDGSWLFYHDPTDGPGGMRAATLDMPTMQHIYPYGVWKGEGSLTHKLTCGVRKNPFKVTIPGYTVPSTTVNSLFKTAMTETVITNLGNPQVNQKPLYSVNTGLSSIILSLPIPSDIVPLAFMLGASVTDTPGNSTLKTPSYQYDAFGVPVSHVLDYPYTITTADPGLQFYSVDDAGKPTLLDTAVRGDHFHFHTEPVMAGGTHEGDEMFANLQRLLLANGQAVAPVLQLSGDNPSDMTPSPFPEDMTVQEVDMQLSGQSAFRVGKTDAACTGGIIGLDCGCDDCSC